MSNTLFFFGLQLQTTSMAHLSAIPPDCKTSFLSTQFHNSSTHIKKLIFSSFHRSLPFKPVSHLELRKGPGFAASSSSSPFTEAHTVPLCVHSQSSHSSRNPNFEAKFDNQEHEIILQLPELHEMLNLLKKRVSEEGREKRVKAGEVYLVGTGPGDPELLTLKAFRLLQTADLILYDRLVSTDILDMVHAGARLLYVGKTAGYHSRTQDEIHELLLNFAEAGAVVVRLKGGDPLVFGRGGEEMDFLQQQGIEVKVIPGITAASGIAAELGIPLTHRGVANSVRFLTGHSRKGGTDPLFLSTNATDPDTTLVVYMGLATLPSLAEKLISNGLFPKTPAVAVERGTTSQQRMVFAVLEDLPCKVKAANLVSPTLIIIGNVVALSPDWAERNQRLNQSTDMYATSEVL